MENERGCITTNATETQRLEEVLRTLPGAENTFLGGHTAISTGVRRDALVLHCFPRLCDYFLTTCPVSPMQCHMFKAFVVAAFPPDGLISTAVSVFLHNRPPQNSVTSDNSHLGDA